MTTHRIAKKHAARLAVACFDLPYVLSLAKPSLYQLSFGTMRTYVYHVVRRKCGVNARVAKLVTWRWAEGRQDGQISLTKPIHMVRP